MNTPDKNKNLMGRMKNVAESNRPKALEVLDVKETPISKEELKDYALEKGLNFKQTTNELIDKVDTKGLDQNEVGELQKFVNERSAELLRNNDELVDRMIAEARGDTQVSEQPKVEETVNMGYSEQQPMNMEQAQEVPVSQKVEELKPTITQPENKTNITEKIVDGKRSISAEIISPRSEPLVKQVEMTETEEQYSARTGLVKENGVWTNTPTKKVEAVSDTNIEESQNKTPGIGIENKDEDKSKGNALFKTISAGLKEELDILDFATKPIRSKTNEFFSGAINFVKENIAIEEFRPWKMATGESFISFAKRKNEQFKEYNKKQAEIQKALDLAEKEKTEALIKSVKDGVSSLFKNLIGVAVGSYESLVQAKNEVMRWHTKKVNEYKYEILKSLQSVSIEFTKKVESKMKTIDQLDSKILAAPAENKTNLEQAPVSEDNSSKVEDVKTFVNPETIETGGTTTVKSVESTSINNESIPEIISDEIFNKFTDFPKEKYKVPDNIIIGIAKKKIEAKQLTSREIAIQNLYEKEIASVVEIANKTGSVPETLNTEAKVETAPEPAKIEANVSVEKVNDKDLEKIESLKQEIAKMEQVAQFASGGDRARQEKYILEAKAELDYMNKKNEKPAESSPKSAIEEHADEAQIGGYNKDAFANMMNQAKVANEENNGNA